MGVLTATFENGVNGATLATTDAGAATPWDVVVIPAGGTLAYDNTHSYGGLLSLQLAVGVTSGTIHFDWQAALGTVKEHYGRMYLFFSANPGTSRRILRCRNGGTTAASLDVRTDGKLNLLDSAGNIVATTTAAITTGSWIRVEWHFIHSSTVGQLEIKLFNFPDSTNPTETLTSAANLDTQPSIDAIQFGNINAQANVTAWWFDNIVANDLSYPGPLLAPILPSPPMIHGRGAA